MEKIRIDLFADIACPWCYIGEARLQKALAQRPELEAEWHWHPFQLAPDVPPAGVPWKTFVEAKFGSAERAAGMFAQVAAVAAQDGLELAFDRMTISPSTRAAHRLVLLGTDSQQKQRIVEGLFKAHFTEGENVGDIETLVKIGAEAGLDAARVREYMMSDENADAVEASQRAAEQTGVSGVPFYIFNERYAFSGAQPVDTFLRAIDAAVQPAAGPDAAQ